MNTPTKGQSSAPPSPETPEAHAGRPPSVQPPLTPMIDVTFQLLIFFLLTTTFRMQEGTLPGSLPKILPPIVGKGVSESARLHVYVRPGAAGGVRFEIQGVATAMTSPADLHRHLEGRLRAVGGQEYVNVLIHVRGDAEWRWAVEAQNQALRAGFRQVGFAFAQLARR